MLWDASCHLVRIRVGADLAEFRGENSSSTLQTAPLQLQAMQQGHMAVEKEQANPQAPYLAASRTSQNFCSKASHLLLNTKMGKS